MQATEAFPAYAVEMVRVGEASGRTERGCAALARITTASGDRSRNYKTQLATQLRFLCNEHHLGIHGHLILPIFSKTYDNIAGSLTNGSFSMVGVSVAIGWAALIVVLVSTIAALVLWGLSHNESGRMRVAKLFEKFPQRARPCIK